MNAEQKCLISAMRSVLHPESGALPDFSGCDWDKLIRLAARHSISSNLAYAVENLPDALLPDKRITDVLQKHQMMSLAKWESQQLVYDEMVELFERSGVCFMPVKGICTRARYPDPRLRTMGDIDALYKSEQTKIVRQLMDELGTDDFSPGRKNDSYEIAPHVEIEMHRRLLDTGSSVSAYYDDIWDRAVRKDGYSYIYEMTIEDEYIFNILHLAVHFKAGGVGIRFLMDVYVYEHSDAYHGNGIDRNYLESELKRLGLFEFYNNIRAVSESWFGLNAKDNLTAVQRQIAEYVLGSGTFGTEDSKADIAASRGRMRYAAQNIFPPYESMATRFLWIGKHPALLPAAWGIRIVGALSKKDKIDSFMKKTTSGSKEAGERLAAFYGECGLKEEI